MKNKKVIYSFLIIFTLVFSYMLPNMKAFANDVPSVTNDYQILPGATTSSRISIENKDSMDHSYSLAFEQIPNDFNGYFTTDGKLIQTIDIAAGHKSIVYFSIDVPVTTTTSCLSIPANITREDGIKETLTMSYTLNQDYALSITSNVSLMKAINGDSIMLEIGVTNTGNKDLTNLTLATNPPYKWVMDSIKPASLNIKTGETGLYEVKVTVPSSQQAGEYPIKISCANSQVTSNEITIPVAVSTNINYFWWVASLVVILAVFTIFYFRKHGRR